MIKSNRPPMFRSRLGTLMEEFLAEKRTLGYKYRTGEVLLRNLDRFLAEHGLSSAVLPRPLAEGWAKRGANEWATSHAHRITLIRQFAAFLHRRGIEAHLPAPAMTRNDDAGFAPFIFTRAQMRALFDAVDRIPPCPQAPGREHLLPFLFRLLYCCGFRAGEALRLELRDVDTERGILLVRQGKFGYDRLVPLSESMRRRLTAYRMVRPAVPPCAYLFPSRHGNAYCHRMLYQIFRRLLFACGIGHGGRRKGPRLHDLRHTFAVHRLELWYRQGGNLMDQLPVLSVYLGHKSLAGTQRYLRITPALFPDITDRMNAFCGPLIPRRANP